MTRLAENREIEQIPSAEEWEYKFVEDLSRGINVSLYPQGIDEQQLVTARNVREQEGRITLAHGYAAFGGAIRGNPRKEHQVFFKNGSSKLVLITNLTFYEWAASPAEWQYVSNGTSTTLTVAAVATDTALTVADITGFADGEHIGILLDDGTQHQTTVNGAPSGNTINITDQMPSGAGIGKAVVEAVLFSGTDAVQPTIVTWSAFDKAYMANGADTPKQYDGTTIEDISNLPGTTFVCREVALYRDFLLLMYTIEDGTTYPQRVRWCNAGDPTAWNELENFNDLYRTADKIVGSENLGPYHVVYKERSVVRMELVGSPNKVFDFITVVPKKGGVIAADTIIDLEDRNMIVSESNIYSYDGGFTLRPLGERIWENIFGVGGRLDPTNRTKAFLLDVVEADEAWFVYPKNGDTYPKDCLTRKHTTGAFFSREFGVNITGFGRFQKSSAKRWADLQGSWEQQVGPWVGSQLQANSPTIHLCSWDTTNGQVYEIDYTKTDDAGTAISYEVETRDFYYPNRFIRTNRFEFKLAGTDVLVEYSTDEGDNWDALKTFSPGAVIQRVRHYKQIHCRTIRFRFSGSKGFTLQWIAFTWKRESVW